MLRFFITVVPVISVTAREKGPDQNPANILGMMRTQEFFSVKKPLSSFP
jgi:hypothetical protein